MISLREGFEQTLSFVSDLLRLKRRSLAFGHCLSTTRTSQVVDFYADGLLGGIVHGGSGFEPKPSMFDHIVGVPQ